MATNRWLKRSLLIAALLLALVALLSGVGVMLFRSTPSWYSPRKFGSEAQRRQWAQEAENKLIDVQNWAADLRGDAVRTARAQESGVVAPATRAAASMDFELSQDQSNALFEKWSVFYGWRNKYRGYVDEPEIVLDDGKLICAAKVASIGAIVSVQLRPRIDDAGMLRLDLVEVAGGRLPLPDAAWSSYRRNLEVALVRRLNEWRRAAKIDASGAANSAAMEFTMARLVLHALRRQPADPVLFLPLADGGDSVPVKLTGVTIDDEKLTLAVMPMSQSERATLLNRMKSGN